MRVGVNSHHSVRSVTLDHLVNVRLGANGPEVGGTHLMAVKQYSLQSTPNPLSCLHAVSADSLHYRVAFNAACCLDVTLLSCSKSAATARLAL